MSPGPPAADALRARLLSSRSPADGLAYLAGLSPSVIRLGLDRVHAALEKLGHPERRLRAVHVAGTNGKGSTCAFIASCLQRRYRTGLYTSPHLERVNERFSVDGKAITDEVLGRRVLEVVERLPEQHELSYFEFGTLVALWHFEKEGVELAVLETGLGGRLDATNACHPLVTTITSISLDHTALLGDTLGAIAGEKAGIIKRGVPVVTCRQPPEAQDVLWRTAREREAPLFIDGREFVLEVQPSGRLRWTGVSGRLEGIALGLKGRHQHQNAALALASLDLLREQGVTLSDQALHAGLAEVRWPGRLEEVAHGPPLVLDGAHNPDGALALVRALEEVYATRPVHLVFGVLADKDAEAMMATLFPRCATIDLAPVDSPRSRLPADYQARALSLCPRTFAHPSASAALAAARARASAGDVVVVAGSLVLLGELRRTLVPPSLD